MGSVGLLLTVCYFLLSALDCILGLWMVVELNHTGYRLLYFWNPIIAAMIGIFVSLFFRGLHQCFLYVVRNRKKRVFFFWLIGGVLCLFDFLYPLATLLSLNVSGFNDAIGGDNEKYMVPFWIWSITHFIDSLVFSAFLMHDFFLVTSIAKNL